jgi:tetratricopeptide (TPR) repeat protein
VRRALEQNRYVIATALERRGRIDEAIAGFRESADSASALRAEDPSNAMYVRDVGYAQTQIGNLEGRRGNAAAALEAYRAALAAFSQLEAADAKSADARIGVAMSHHNVGEALAELGREEEAFAELRLARPSYEAIVKGSPSNVWVTGMLADLYSELASMDKGSPASACALARRSVELFEKLSSSGTLNAQRQSLFADARALLAKCPPAAPSGPSNTAAAPR